MKVKNKKIVGYISIIALLVISFLLCFWVSNTQPLNDAVMLTDVFGELPLVLIVFIWILVIQKLISNKKIYTPLLIGFSLFLFGTIIDVLDEVYDMSSSSVFPQIENVGIPLGLFIASIGIYLWVEKLNEQNSVLGDLNKDLSSVMKKWKTSQSSLENTKQELVDKNKELEKTLEDFYMIRTGMERDMKKGVLEKENKKIKKKLDKLKK